MVDLSHFLKEQTCVSAEYIQDPESRTQNQYNIFDIKSAPKTTNHLSTKLSSPVFRKSPIMSSPPSISMSAKLTELLILNFRRVKMKGKVYFQIFIVKKIVRDNLEY